MRRIRGPAPTVKRIPLVEQACRAVGEFLKNAGPEDRTLALEALQIAIRATTTDVEISGIVPVDKDSYLLADTHADARRPVINRPVSAFRSG